MQLKMSSESSSFNPQNHQAPSIQPQQPIQSFSSFPVFVPSAASLQPPAGPPTYSIYSYFLPTLQVASGMIPPPPQAQNDIQHDRNQPSSALYRPKNHINKQAPPKSGKAQPKKKKAQGSSGDQAISEQGAAPAKGGSMMSMIQASLDDLALEISRGTAQKIQQKLKTQKKETSQQFVQEIRGRNEEKKQAVTEVVAEKMESLSPVREQQRVTEMEKEFNEWSVPLDLTKPKPVIKKQKQDSKKEDKGLESVEKKVKPQFSNVNGEIPLKDSKEEAKIDPPSQQKNQSRPQSKPIMTEAEKLAMIQESDEYKMWKSIPKAQRERLTKKQMMRVMKPDILAEGLALQVAEAKPKKIIKALVEEEPDQTFQAQPKIDKPQPSQKLQSATSSALPQKQFKEQPQQPFQPKVQMKIAPNQADNFKLKSKPKKIVVEERNEFNEIVRQIVEKARKRKITTLKKAILKKREAHSAKIHVRREGKRIKAEGDEDDSGFETIDENGVEVKQITASQEKEESKLVPTKGLPYARVFSDLEALATQVESELLRTFQNTSHSAQQASSQELDPGYVRFSDVVNDNDLHQFNLHPKKFIRDYVDVLQTPELEQSVFSLIQKLKKLYFNRKTNPTNKKGKMARGLKKRYILGMKEVMKHLSAENLKMIILAVNLEQVEGENGLDGMIYDIIQATRDQKIPLVFCLNRYKMGYVAKFQGQLASIIGIFNFQGANEEFNNLAAKTKDLRETFYKQIAKNLSDYQVKLLRKENRFLDWQLFDRLKDQNYFY